MNDPVELARHKQFQNSVRAVPIFDNSAKETWREFEQRFRIWLELHEVTNMVGIPKQKLALAMAMKGDAMRAVEQHGPRTPSFEAAATLEAYITLLRECFNPPSESQTARTDFERRKQGRLEPAVVFLSYKRALYHHAFPTEAQRSFSYFKNEVLKGLYATYVKQKVIEADPATDAALETCVINAVGKARALFYNKCDVIASLDGLESTTRQKAYGGDGDPEDRMEWESSKRVDGGKDKCHLCKKPGHFARDCPEKRRGGPSQGGKGNPDRDVICNHCKKKGHKQKNCWQLHPHLKKGRKGGGQAKGGPKSRRVGGDGDDPDPDVEYEDDFDELEGADEGAKRIQELEPEHPFRLSAVPQRRGKGNRRN